MMRRQNCRADTAARGEPRILAGKPINTGAAGATLVAARLSPRADERPGRSERFGGIRIAARRVMRARPVRRSKSPGGRLTRRALDFARRLRNIELRSQHRDLCHDHHPQSTRE
jgi:hypothetical protein